MNFLELVNSAFVLNVQKTEDDTDPAMSPTSYGVQLTPWAWCAPYPGLDIGAISEQFGCLLSDIPVSYRERINSAHIVQGAIISTINYMATTGQTLAFSSVVVISQQGDDIYSTAVLANAFESVFVPVGARIYVLSNSIPGEIVLKYTDTAPDPNEMEGDKLTIICPSFMAESDFNFIGDLELLPVIQEIVRPQPPYGVPVIIAEKMQSLSLSNLTLALLPYASPPVMNASLGRALRTIPAAVLRWTGSAYINNPLLFDNVDNRPRYIAQIPYVGGRFPVMDVTFNNLIIEGHSMISQLGSVYLTAAAPNQSSVGEVLTARGQVMVSEETSFFYLSGSNLRHIPNIVTASTSTTNQFDQRLHNQSGIRGVGITFYSPRS